MSSLYFKLIPLVVSCILFLCAFRAHERFWALGFSGWRRIYSGLGLMFVGALLGVFFEFSELRDWQTQLGWPFDWVFSSLFFSLGTGLILWGALERLRLAAREKAELDQRREAFELFDSIRDAAAGPYSFLEILNFALKEMILKTEADAGGIWLIHPSGQEFILASASGFALPLQQKLEKPAITHPGFSRLIEAQSPREMSNPESLRHWFPEFSQLEFGYQSLYGIPLVAGFGQGRREAVGLILICRHNKDILHPAYPKLLGSATSFLATTIAQAKISRQLRTQRSSLERLQAGQAEYADWSAGWFAEEEPRRRLRLAVSGLAGFCGEFVGCGMYLAERWQPLALAAAGDNDHLLGEKQFRAVAATAAETGQETFYHAGEEATSVRYRLIPVRLPARRESPVAVIFVPVVESVPGWWEQAIHTLVELTRVVLFIENQLPENPVREKPTTIPLPKLPPLPSDGTSLNKLLAKDLIRQPDKLPAAIAAVLPAGWRMVRWQRIPGEQKNYHARLVVFPDGSSRYYSIEELPVSPGAARGEIEALLGGLVRLEQAALHSLAEIWPDADLQRRAYLFPAVYTEKSNGWTTFYQPSERGEATQEQLEFLQKLSSLLELLILQLDRHQSIGEQDLEFKPVEEPVTAPPVAPSDHQREEEMVPLDQAVASWVSEQATRVQLGEVLFPSPPETCPSLPRAFITDVLGWSLTNFENGQPLVDYFALDVLAKRDWVSVSLRRMPDSTDNGATGAPLLPVDPHLRRLLKDRAGESRIFNSITGPVKLSLEFNPLAQEKKAPTSAGILIVEDQPLIHDLLLGMLEVLGRKARAVDTAALAISVCAADVIDVVIIGNHQVNEATADLAARIKEQRPQTRVILLGEFGRLKPAGSASSPVDYFLAKPFRLNDLRSALGAYAAAELS